MFSFDFITSKTSFVMSFGWEVENLIIKYDRKKNYSKPIIKKLAYIGNQILLNNEKEINKYC